MIPSEPSNFSKAVNPAPIGNAEQPGKTEDAADAPATDEAAERKTGDVVALDAFRKKKT